MNVGQRIKALRKQQNMTLRELSQKVGISISFLSDIENGRSNPSLERLKEIAEALDTTVSYLLGEEIKTDDPNPSKKTVDDEIMEIMRELGPDVTNMFYDLKGMSQEEKESLKIFLQGLLARRKQREDKE